MRASLLRVISLAVLPVLSAALPSLTGAGTLKVPLEKRSGLLNRNGVVNKEALTRQLVRTENKIQRGFKAFRQNTGLSHPSDTKRTDRRAVGNDPLTDVDEVLWFGRISVGTPAKVFTVDFDTGSSDLFLPGANCDVNCNGHRLYDTESSSTARDQGRTYRLAFGDGSTVEGEVFHDTVTLAGLTATNQAVGSSDRYSDGFAVDNFPPDGLLGMAFPEISVFEENPVFQSLVAQGKTTEPVFAFKLARSRSELTLGGADSSQFSGSLTQVPVTTQGFWQIDVDGVNVSGGTPVRSVSAIVDTGTTLLLGDERSVNAFYAAIPGSQDASDTIGPGFFTIPCDSIPTDISLTLSSRSFPISANTFNLGLVAEGSSDCVGGLAVGGPDGLWVLGDVFLQNVYSVFDVRSNQVGFATPA